MTATEHYNLHMPELTDPVDIAPLNENALVVDTALHTLANTMGNCQLATGSYVGDGTYGKDHAIRLEFAFSPLLVIISGSHMSGIENGIVLFGRGFVHAAVRSDPSSSVTSSISNVTWEDYALSFYDNNSAYHQLNTADSTYTYIAFGYLL